MATKYTVCRWSPLLQQAVFPSEDKEYIYDNEEEAKHEAEVINNLAKLIEGRTEDHRPYQTSIIYHQNGLCGNHTDEQIGGVIIATTCPKCLKRMNELGI